MLQIYSRELHSVQSQQEFFESEMQKKNQYIPLDFTKSGEYNAYQDEKTAIAFVYFISGVFSCLGQ